MKVKLKENWKSTLIILFIILVTLIVIPNFFTSILMDTIDPNDNPSAATFGGGTVTLLDIIWGHTRTIKEIPPIPPVHTDPPEVEVTQYREVGVGTGDPVTVPNVPETEMYCMQMDEEFWRTGLTRHYRNSLEGSDKYGSYTHYNVPNPQTQVTYYHRHLPHVLNTWDGDYSYPWLVKEGDRNLLTDADIKLAYILTSEEIGEWNDEKQIALWGVQNQTAKNDLAKEADQYEEYYLATQKSATSGAGSTEQPDLQIRGEIKDITVFTHYDENGDSTITIGPIKLNYINKNNDDIAFEGISSMYFTGVNSKGETIMASGSSSPKHIRIEEFIDSAGHHPLKFFNPNDHFVDRQQQSYPDGSTDGGNFYVVIKDPNYGKTSADDDYIFQLQLHIAFKWMTVFKAEASDLNAYEYQVNWFYHNGTKHNDGTPRHPRWDWDCTRIVKLDESELQKVLNFYGGARELFTTSMTIDQIDISMDLGGSVWEDGVALKESQADGISSTTPGPDGNLIDKPISGIKVNLWAYNESLWGTTPQFVTYTYTDDEGNYMFYKLNSLLKYFVTFEYNGQQYLPTEYLNSGSGRYSSAYNMAVDNNIYNGEQLWHTTSKGTEKSSDRDLFDQRFAEIGSAPKNYESTDSLSSGYLVDGYNEAYSKYDLMGFRLDENGKYYIDPDYQLIDGFYTLQDGVIVTSDSLVEGRISQAIKDKIQTYSDSQKASLETQLDIEINQRKNDWDRKIDRFLENKKDEIKYDDFAREKADPQTSLERLEEIEMYEEMIEDVDVAQRQSGKVRLERERTIRKGYIEDMIIMPDYNNLIREVYTDIANSVSDPADMWRRLQFIEDSKISSYTQNLNEELDLYPVYDDMYINPVMELQSDGSTQPREYSKISDKQNDPDYDINTKLVGGDIYYPIYEGQFFINQGLWVRQEYDSALRKDVYRAVMKLNGHTEVYKYNKRVQEDTDGSGNNKANGIDGDSYWDIRIRMSDYDNYYGTTYNRELYLTDYDFGISLAPNHPSAQTHPLEIFVTYKITVRNQSMSTKTQIKEVVDFYDKEFTYREDLSWVMYEDDNLSTDFTQEEYYDAIDLVDISKIENQRPINSSDASTYGVKTHSDIATDGLYNAVYVRGLENKILSSGESAYIYLTYQINKDDDHRIILDDETRDSAATPKMNYAEINGFTTFYAENTELPNDVVKSQNGRLDVAGLVDRDSTPGNLRKVDITGQGKVEKNFEDDTDRAPALRVIVDEEDIRQINGTVWEDQRTEQSGDAYIGDGIYDEGNEVGISGVTIQLVEKLKNSTGIDEEFVWYQTTTDDNGAYEFKNYIPGDYVVRFYYGNNTDTVELGANDVSYNGQDFKSTIYQKDMEQKDVTNDYQRDTEKQYRGYQDVTGQNTSGSYGYDIFTTDSYGTRVSDAKDLWTTDNILNRNYNNTGSVDVYETKDIKGRLSVIDYSKSEVTNHKASVLTSPYGDYSDEFIDELIENTYMTAETGVMDIEFEYSRNMTDIDQALNDSNLYLNGNNEDGHYIMDNVDFGLVERPKAQLEIDKSITNAKLTLANGEVQFDANAESPFDNVTWIDHSSYKIEDLLQNGKFEDYYGQSGKNRYSLREDRIDQIVAQADKGEADLALSEELIHGATIQITYAIEIKNVGETDYEGEEFYYLGEATGDVVTTTPDQVIDYVVNNIKYDSGNAVNAGWSYISRDEIVPDQGQYDSDNNLVNTDFYDALGKFNTIIQTSDAELDKALKPDESVSKTLVLSQLLTMENKEDDMNYTNLTEIVKTSNTVGRRMAFSVVGNQNPLADRPGEIDSNISERLRILTGTGDIHIPYVLIIVVAIMLIGSIIIIIRKVLLTKRVK